MIQKDFFNFFPTPAYLSMPAIGLDISDTAVRFATLKKARHGFTLGNFGEEFFGVTPDGQEITANNDLQKILRKIHDERKFNFINASLPEEKAYLFKTELEKVEKKMIRGALEFKLEENVPIPARDAVFDYDIMEKRTKEDGHIDISVSVLPSKVVNDFVSLFYGCGMRPLSFKIEAQAIARAVVHDGDPSTALIVNFDEIHTGLYIVSEGVVHFTSTLNIGGSSLTSAIKKQCNVSLEEAVKIKKENGLIKSKKNIELFYSLMSTMSVLRDEVNRVLSYWRTHSTEAKDKNKIDRIILCGGDTALAGFDEYFALSLKIPVERANVWSNVCDLNQYIPEISFSDSLRYGAAIGLALPPRH